mmetsp:Transcript_24739/g.58698  ORF Transcript_24739/g.58698 Transcript_24739/m.58698 type:complete len:303 (+) Transcript_24739:190-1098(+)
MMSCVPMNRKSETGEACANCGKHGSDTVKLKNCTACSLVKYCGVDCQRAHRKQHKKACKQRAAELKDDQKYIQGHARPEVDFCPICTLPIPLPVHENAKWNVCCMKLICQGCNLAARKRRMVNCLYCRTPSPKNDADRLAMIQARVVKKDPEAINRLGEAYCHGEFGLLEDMRKAVELWEEAAELGSIPALDNLGVAHYHGAGVDKNVAKGAEFYEKAAMQGHVDSRYNVACIELEKMNNYRALRHFLIAAKMGHEDSLGTVKRLFVGGIATKAQYAEAIQGYQKAAEEMKSHDRDEAKRIS